MKPGLRHPRFLPLLLFCFCFCFRFFLPPSFFCAEIREERRVGRTKRDRPIYVCGV